MEVRPILSAMFRNKTGLVLVALQIALTLAVVTNACFIIQQRIEKIGRPPGLDGDNIFYVQSYGFSPQYDHVETVRRDLEMIRSLPGVKAASPTNGIPLSGSGNASTFRGTPLSKGADISANTYMVDEQGIEAFGVKLIAGRPFLPQEVLVNKSMATDKFAHSVIITVDYAKALFGNEPALGKTIYNGFDQAATVVGIIDNMLGAWVDNPNITHVIFLPTVQGGPLANYVVRAEPGRQAELMRQVQFKLSASNPTRTIMAVHPHSYYPERSYKRDSRMVAFLGVLIGLMILVTALGVLGLASFQVRMRTKQIGTRRAIGARRIDIVRHFMLENLLLTCGGLAIGVLLTFAFGQYLSAAFQLPRLEPLYVVWGSVALIALGQAAAFAPARRAASVSPAIATRTV